MRDRSKIDLQMTREVETAKHLAGALGWSYVDLRDYSISCGTLAKVSAELACRWRSVPMVFNEHRIVMVVDDPFTSACVAANSALLGVPHDRRIEFALTTRCALDLALHKRITLVRD